MTTYLVNFIRRDINEIEVCELSVGGEIILRSNYNDCESLIKKLIEQDDWYIEASNGSSYVGMCYKTLMEIWNEANK